MITLYRDISTLKGVIKLVMMTIYKLNLPTIYSFARFQFANIFLAENVAISIFSAKQNTCTHAITILLWSKHYLPSLGRGVQELVGGMKESTHYLIGRKEVK